MARHNPSRLIITHIIQRALLILLVVFSSATRLLASSAVQQLEQGKLIERDLSGGGQDTYEIKLAAGQYASVIVEQRGIDVTVQLQADQDKLIGYFDNEYRCQGEEKIEMVAERTESFRLIVRASSKSAPAGQYRINIAEIRAATNNDRLMHEARKLEVDSKQAIAAGKYENARQYNERALAISEQVLGPEHPYVATLLLDLADYYEDKLDLAKAISLDERALAIREKVFGPEHPHTIEITRLLAYFYHGTNQIAKAEQMARRAFEISQKTLGPEHQLVARCIYILAYVTSDPQKTEQLLQRALLVAEKTLGPDDLFTGVVVEAMGDLYTENGDYQQAEQFLLRSKAIKEKHLGPDNIGRGVI